LRTSRTRQKRTAAIFEHMSPIVMKCLKEWALDSETMRLLVRLSKLNEVVPQKWA
jgi:hypothetical protein